MSITYPYPSTQPHQPPSPIYRTPLATSGLTGPGTTLQQINNHTEVWINGTLVEEYNTAGYYNGTYSSHATREIGVRPVDASGNKGDFVNQTTTIPNNVPVMSPIADQIVAEGETVFIDADATDADSDTLTYSCNETNFTDFDPSTGKGNWTTSTGDAGTYYVDFGVSDGYAVDNETVKITVVLSDSVPPASITNLQNTTGSTWINWTWDNPPDTDFSHVMVFIDGSFVTNTSNSFYNATGFSPETSHQISTHTVDASDNVNQTWVNDTATTFDTAPPASISNLTPSFYNTPDGKQVAVFNGTPFYVNWTWTNPTDADFNHTMIYIDGKFKTNISNDYYLTVFQDLDTYTISTHTVDTSGNVNPVWENNTVKAPTLSKSTNVTFDNVTKNGNTQTTSQTENPGGNPPSGYSLMDYFVDVTTTAEYKDKIKVCINYTSLVSGNENNLRLMHWSSTNGWEEVTTSLYTTNDTVCGEVTTLSPFGVAHYMEVSNYIVGNDVMVNTLCAFNRSYTDIPLYFQINNSLNTSATNFNITVESSLTASQTSASANEWFWVNTSNTGLFWVNVTNADNESEFVNFTVKYYDYGAWIDENKNTIHDAGECFWSTIGETISGTNVSDTVVVHAGVYKEKLAIYHTITLRSACSVFLDCDGTGNGVTITAGGDNTNVYGFNIFNCTNGIYSATTNNTEIKACTIHDNEVGINITDGRNNKVAFNNFYNNTNFGIFYGNVTGLNYTTGWNIDGEYNYWYEEKGPVYCTALNTSDTANCTLHKVTGIPQGDNVSGVDYTPWLRARVYDYVLEDVNGVYQVIDARDVADTELNVSTTNPVRVFVAGFWGNPGTDFVTNIGRFAAVEFNDTGSVVNMTVDMYYTYEDVYGKVESSSKMYYWDGKVDDYWLGTIPNGTLDTTDSGVYTGHLSVYVDSTSTPDNTTSDVMFGIGTYSDPVGGVALPTDKIVASTCVIAAIVAALGIAIAIKRD